jgi:hypothetical protein
MKLLLVEKMKKLGETLFLHQIILPMRQNLLSLLPLILLLSACTYPLEEENFVTLSKEPQAAVSRMDLLNVADTFQLFARSTLLHYKLAVENADTLEVHVYVDNRWQASVPSASGSFTVRAADFDDGYHRLRVLAVTNSGTGSLADQLGAEHVKWEKNWVFLLEKKPALPLAIRDIYPQDGRLMVEWETSEHLTEKEVIFRLKQPPWTEWSYLVSDPSKTSLADSHYVGGEIEVSLRNISINPEHNSPTTTSTAHFSPPEIQDFSSNGYGHLEVAWSKPVFYQNAGQYQIYHDGDLLYTGNDLNDTTVVLDSLPFLTQETLRLRTVAKNKTSDWGEEVYATTSARVMVGERHPWFLDNLVHSAKQPEFGYQLNQQGIAVLYKDSVVRTIEDVAVNSYSHNTVSSDGGFLYVPINNQISRLTRAGEIEVVLASATLNGEQLSPRLFSLANDRFLSFVNKNGASGVFSAGYPADWVYVCDLEGGEIVTQVQVPEGVNGVISTRLSADGKYLAILYPYHLEVHTLSGGEVISTIRLEKNYDKIFFSTKEPHQLVLYYYSGVEVYNLNTNESVQHSLETPSILRNINYDPVTGYLGGECQDFYFVVDPISGVVIRKILVSRNTNLYNFYDGSIYSLRSKLDLKLK